jgi:hypothetical protein
LAAVALGIVIAFGAGIAYATIPDDAGVIHGCYLKATGNLRVIDSERQSCRPIEVAIDWNQSGPPGDPGQPGERGPSDAYAFTGGGSITDTYTTLAEREIPQGSYVVTGRVQLFTGSATTGPRWVSCTVFDTFNQARDNGTVVIESPGGSNGAVSMPLVATIQTAPSTGGSVSVQCSVYPYSGSDYVVGYPSVVATQVAKVH